MAGYTKLFSSIVASTIWREKKETKIVWITMLAMANANGRVDASVPGLADMARVTVDECAEAIQVLSSPDSWSRSKEFEGRRIEAVDGGWIVLNYGKYRENRDAEIRREQNREAQARFRDRKKVSQSKPEVSRDKPQSAQAEAEAEATKTVGRAVRKASALPDDQWLASLASEPAYKGIQVAIEASKCRVWCATNRKEFSRRRLINWLNRTERPITANPSQFTGIQGKDPYKEPSWDWQTAIRERWPITDFPNRARWEEGRWSDVPLDRRSELLKTA